MRNHLPILRVAAVSGKGAADYGGATKAIFLFRLTRRLVRLEYQSPRVGTCELHW